MKKHEISLNRLLSFISASDLELLEQNLQLADLPLKKSLEPANADIEACFFITTGIASVVAMGRNGKSIEVGLIGNEGVTGLPAILGGVRSPNDTFMQVAGTGLRISAIHLREAMAKSPTLSDVLSKFVFAFMIQNSQTVLANGKANIDKRLARWLLMAQDRVASPHVFMTHEFLALMLGVRRPGVTNALHLLEGKGLIRSKRNEVIVLDRKGLEAIADWSYGVAESEYDRLFAVGPNGAAEERLFEEKAGG